MSNQSLLNSLRTPPQQGAQNSLERAAHALPTADRPQRAMLAIAALMTLFLTACDLGGGGSGGGGAAAGGPPATTSGTPSAVNRIDLPAGQLTATLGWAPSEGDVDQYFVYESRNGSEFTYAQAVDTERATVSGTDGEAVQLVVVAINEDGLLSNGSAPSPQLVFHAAEAVTSASESPAAPAPMAVGGGSTSSSPASVQASGALEETPQVAAAPVEEVPSEEIAQDASNSDGLSASMRDLLVRGGARFATAGLTENAEAWLQAQVEQQFSAGVRLVGTGLRDDDEYRELIWQDSAGQILISDGRAVVELESSADIPSTFEEAIRLRPTERFIALSDFDGDARGDWLLEDVSTGEVSIVDGERLETFDGRSNDTLDATLVGHGDFDANGRTELVWLQPDGQLQVSSPSAPTSIPVTDFALAADSQVLAVADLDGDGRDDLLILDRDGFVGRVMNVQQSGRIQFVLEAGPSVATDALEFIVTLDADEDGLADIAWWQDGDYTLWDTQQGPRDF